MKKEILIQQEDLFFDARSDKYTKESPKKRKLFPLFTVFFLFNFKFFSLVKLESSVNKRKHFLYFFLLAGATEIMRLADRPTRELKRERKRSKNRPKVDQLIKFRGFFLYGAFVLINERWRSLIFLLFRLNEIFALFLISERR